MPTSSLERPDCPDENALAAYVEGSLADPVASELCEHLDACADCRTVAADAARVLGEGSTVDVAARASRDPDVREVNELQEKLHARILPGQTIGRYVVRELLGAGGMGAVYVARDPDLDRDVALKVVSPRGAGAEATRRRLLREARSAAKLQHANVVAVYDVGEIGEAAYLAMELVRGSSLRPYVGDPSVPLARRVGWLVDVARALEAAHAQGIVHRDIKPENVMVRDDGAVKVVDFGIARTHSAPDADGPSRITDTGAVVGTPAYMAPEQLRAEEVDPRVDQFAWAVLAHELLAGELPWKSEGLALVAEILTAEPRRLRLCASDEPGRELAHVEGTLQRAMAKSPADRFATMHDVVEALTHGTISSAARTVLAAKRSRGTGALFAGLALALVFVGFLGARAVLPGWRAGPPVAPSASAGLVATAPTLASTTSPAPEASFLAPVPTIRPPTPGRSHGQGLATTASARSSASAAPRSSAPVDMLDLRK
jgi:serine/threonine-protein kinase